MKIVKIVFFFTIHCNPSLAYIAVRDLQSSQRNASVQPAQKSTNREDGTDLAGGDLLLCDLQVNSGSQTKPVGSHFVFLKMWYKRPKYAKW